jgi:hypothetical protein
MRNEETDLSFAEFGDPKRPYTAPRNETELEEVANYLKRMARREGFASSLRLRRLRDAQRRSQPPWSLRSHSSLADRSRLPLRFEEESQPEEDR